MTKKLIIVRHGAAMPGADHDAERRLTPEGEIQAEHAGKWVTSRLPEARVISSPYRRAVQTAAAIARELDAEVHEFPPLTPDSEPQGVIDGLMNEHGDLVLVSHLPMVGRLAALLVDGQVYDQPWSTAECWLLEGDLIAAGCMQVVAVWYPGLES